MKDGIPRSLIYRSVGAQPRMELLKGLQDKPQDKNFLASLKQFTHHYKLHNYLSPPVLRSSSAFSVALLEAAKRALRHDNKYEAQTYLVMLSKQDDATFSIIKNELLQTIAQACPEVTTNSASDNNSNLEYVRRSKETEILSQFWQKLFSPWAT